MSSTKLRRLAIVIGIDSYPSPADRLQGCVGDARRFGFFLLSARGGSFDKVISLMDHEATSDHLQGVLQRAANKNWEQVVVYFAGHGSPEGIAAWDELLHFQQLAPAIMSIPARWHLLVLDACYSGAVHEYFGFDGIGGLEKHATADAARIYLELLREAAPGLRVITAVDRHTKSLEVGAKGVFTTALLRAARRALPDLNSWGVSASRLLAIARGMLVGEQHPIPQGSGSLNDFPMAVTDAVHPLGLIEPQNIQLRWEQPFGSPLQAIFDFSVDIGGRTLMPVWIQHHLHDGMNRLNLTAPHKEIPRSNHESKPFFVQVPAHRLPRGRAVHSIVTVTDERKRLLGQHVKTYLGLKPLRFVPQPVRVLRYP